MQRTTMVQSFGTELKTTGDQFEGQSSIGDGKANILHSLVADIHSELKATSDSFTFFERHRVFEEGEDDKYNRIQAKIILLLNQLETEADVLQSIARIYKCLYEMENQRSKKIGQSGLRMRDILSTTIQKLDCISWEDLSKLANDFNYYSATRLSLITLVDIKKASAQRRETQEAKVRFHLNEEQYKNKFIFLKEGIQNIVTPLQQELKQLKQSQRVDLLEQKKMELMSRLASLKSPWQQLKDLKEDLEYTSRCAMKEKKIEEKWEEPCAIDLGYNHCRKEPHIHSGVREITIQVEDEFARYRARAELADLMPSFQEAELKLPRDEIAAVELQLATVKRDIAIASSKETRIANKILSVLEPYQSRSEHLDKCESDFEMFLCLEKLINDSSLYEGLAQLISILDEKQFIDLLALIKRLQKEEVFLSYVPSRFNAKVKEGFANIQIEGTASAPPQEISPDQLVADAAVPQSVVLAPSAPLPPPKLALPEVDKTAEKKDERREGESFASTLMIAEKLKDQEQSQPVSLSSAYDEQEEPGCEREDKRKEGEPLVSVSSVLKAQEEEPGFSPPVPVVLGFFSPQNAIRVSARALGSQSIAHPTAKNKTAIVM